METDKIIEIVKDIFAGADERNWTKVQNAMAQDVWFDYSSLSGNPPAMLASKQIIEAWKRFLPGFDETRHRLFAFKVTQAKNRAVIYFEGKADHFIDNEIWTVEGNYKVEAVKEINEWHVDKIIFNLMKQSGNMNLPALAAQKAAQ